MIRLAAVALAVAALCGASAASGWWSTQSTTGSNGAAQASALAKASTPTVGAVGSTVTVQFAPLSSPAGVGYVVRRYASSGGVPTGSPSTVGCTPVLSGGQMTCTDSGLGSGTYQYTVVAALNNWRGPESGSSVPVQVDAIAPTTSASLSPAPNAAGWNRTAPVSLTLTATDDVGGSGVALIRYTTDGSDPTSSATASTYSAPISLSSTTTVRYAARDVAGNWETPKTQAVRIDTAAPANGLALTNVTGGVYLGGTTLWYRGAAAGSFQLSNTVTDSGGSGPASSTTSALSGTATGWTHTSSTVAGASPYVSNSFSWTAGTTATPSESVSAADVAGNTSATTLSFTLDNTAPTTTGSFSPAANGAGWNNSAVTVTLSSTDNGGGSGVASIRYTTDGSAPAISPTAIVYSGPFTVGASATVRWAATDNVGNVETAKSQTLQIDALAPSPSLALSSVTGGAYQSGSTVFYRGVAAGSFRLTNTVTDSGGSGAASSATAALAGGAAGWTHTPSTVTGVSPYVSNTFSWAAGTTSAPSETVTTSDVAGNQTQTTLAYLNDSTGPTVTPVFPTAATYSSGANWLGGCGTAGSADICGNLADAGAGVASATMVLTRVADGKCFNPANGKFQNGSCNGVPLTVGAGSPSWTVNFPCTVGSYTLVISPTDNVGNTSTGATQSWQITSCA